MKTETKAVVFALFLGVLAWLGSGVFRCLLSPEPAPAESSLWLGILTANIPGRLFVLGLFMVSGVVTGRVLRQRRLAQDDLRESRSRYAQLFDRAPDGMWEISRDGLVEQANAALCELAGLPHEEIIGHPCSEILHTARCGTDQCPLRLALDGQPTDECELAVTRSDGRQALCVVHSRPVLDTRGVVRGLAQSYRNLTEQRKAEARFQALVETTGDAVTILDPQGLITYANDAFCEMLGYAPDEVLGRASTALCDAANQKILAEQLERRLTGADAHYELQYTRRDGQGVSVLISATPLFDEQGAYAGSFAVMKNVTEMKQAAAQMAHLNSVLRAIRNVNQLITREHDREQLLQQACECLVEPRGYLFAGIALMDAEGQMTAEHGAGELAGLSPDEQRVLIANAWQAVSEPPQARAVVLDPATEALGRWQGPWPEGCSCMATRLEYAGRTHGVLGVLIPTAMAQSAEEQSLFDEVAGDIAFALHAIATEQQRQQAEARLTAEHERSHRMLDTAGALIVSLDTAGRITFFNRRCQEVTGYTAEEVMGRPVWEVLVPPRLAASVREVFSDLVGPSDHNAHENPWMTKDGRERLISWRNTRICGEDGEVSEIVGIGLDITEHRAAEMAVKRSEERYRLLFNSSQDAVFVYELLADGTAGRFLEANDVAQEKFGYSRRELLGMTPEQLDAPGEIERLDDILPRLLAEQHVLFEQDHITRDGGIIPTEVSAHLFEFDGRPAVLSVARDITERRQAEEQVAHLNSVLLAIRNVNQLITRETDRDKLLQTACDCLVETRGYSMAVIVLVGDGGEMAAAYGAPAGWSALAAELDAGGEVWALLRQQSGPPAPVVLGERQCLWGQSLADEWQAGRTGMIVRLEWGGVSYGFLGISLPAHLADNEEEQGLFREVADDIAFALHALDLADQRQQALERLEMTQFAIDRAADGVFWIDREGRILYVNQAACDRLGYSSEELMALRVTDLDPHLPQEAWAAHWERVRGDRAVTIESAHRARDGRLIPMEITINHFRFKGEDYHFTFARDITERKRAEQELQRLNRQYALLVESQLVETFIIQRDKLVFANSTMHERLGYPAGSLIGKNVRELLLPERREEVLPWRVQQAREADDRSRELETQVVTREGTPRWVQVWSQEIGDFEGAPAIIGHMVDVTEARELRNQLEHSQRLEALGTLAGGVAHEFNNVLQAILLNASLLQMDRALSATEAEKIKSIIERTEYGARLTDQLLTFSRRAPAQYQPLNLNDVIEETRALLERTVPRQITIACDLSPDLWAVNADAGRLKQVLINLALNARDAMPTGGRLTFSTSNVVLARSSLATLPKLQPGPHVVVRVTDTGVGMDAQTMSRVFEPFFTTKGVGQGTGLGLSIVHGIVDTHGGCVRLQSRPGEGTTFQVYLPAEPEAEAKALQPAERVIAYGGGMETILIVDDEAEVLSGAEQVLRNYGYRVLTARSGQKALDICATREEPVDLVLLDLVMPGMSGQETLVRLHELDPSLKVVIASGYVPQGERDAQSDRVAGHLEKPFTPHRMLEVVRQVLDRG